MYVGVSVQKKLDSIHICSLLTSFLYAQENIPVTNSVCCYDPRLKLQVRHPHVWMLVCDDVSRACVDV